VTTEPEAAALARLYDLDLAEPPGDLDLYVALAARSGGPIAELAVGTGRLAVPLAAAGFTVWGVDIDPAMLARAGSRAESIDPAARDRLHLVEGDMVETVEAGRLPAGTFRLTFVGLNSILLLTEPERQRAAMAALSRLLAPGGLAVVDAWLPTPIDLVAFDGRLSLEWLRRDPETGREVAKLAAAWLDPVRRVVTLTTIFDEAVPGGAVSRWTRQDALRLVSPDELVAAVTEAGLAVEHLAGGYGLEPLDAASERVIVVARKPGSSRSP
jgi:SAM-dependent methyltransferase